MPSANFGTSLLKTHICMQCKRAFEKRKYLLDHIEDSHVKSLKCELCDYHLALRRRARMVRHM